MNNDLKFLIIDDSSVDRLIARVMLKSRFEEKNIFQADKVSGGINWLMENKSSLDGPLVILLDIRMPEMGGFDFMETYNKLDEAIRKDTTILLLSSTMDLSDLNRAENYNDVKGILEKPLNLNDLAKFLETD